MFISKSTPPMGWGGRELRPQCLTSVFRAVFWGGGGEGGGQFESSGFGA